MSKDARDRFDEALSYVRQHAGLSIATQISQLTAGHEAAIGDELSIGTRWDVFSRQATKDVHTQQRLALRALLLCQRVYFSDLWPCLIGTLATRTPVNWLPDGWKAQSTGYWGNRTAAQIHEALRMFVAVSDNPDHAANAAMSGQPSASGVPQLTATRAQFDGAAATTCYDAVMLWLFKSGLVSLRWLLRHRNGNTDATLTDAFGAGTVLWNGPFTVNDALPDVPRGHVVHIWENDLAWRGHWMVSLGNGRAAGCNNNTEGTLPRHYCNQLTLKGQFLDFGGGKAVVIDPRLIPARL